MNLSRIIISGIKKAHQSYYAMAGTWLWEGCEYYLTVNIAQKIKASEVTDWVTLEEPVRNIYFQKGSGRFNTELRKKGRVDIALWLGDDGTEVPAVIEVKSSVSPSTCVADFQRLYKVASKSKTTEGYFAYYCSQEKPNADSVITWLETRAKDLKSKAENIALDDNIKVVSTYEITKPEKFGGTFSSALFVAMRFHNEN